MKVRSSTTLGWVLVAYLVGEFLLFDQLGVRRHTWVFPRWNDQIQYLTESYRAYEDAHEHGVVVAAWHALVNSSAQGTLHDLGALVTFTLTGPSRSAALSLNLLALIAWQVALYATVRRLSGSTALAWISASILLALHLPWSGSPGSAIDFRLDWMAACMMGVAAASAAATDRFRSTRGSIGFGLAVAATLLTRFLTGTYFVVIYAVFLGWILGARDERPRRVRNLFFSALLPAVLAGPIFWLNREWVYNYYVIGHFTGPESAIRSPNMGLWPSTHWLWSRLFGDHLGPTFLWLVLLVTLATGLVFWVARRKRQPAQETRPGISAVVPLAFLLGPALVLTLHQQKSELVLSILLPGAVLLCVAAWQRLSAGADRRVMAVIAGLVVCASSTYYVRRQLTPAHTPEFEAGARRVSALSDHIFERSRAAGLEFPRVGVDRVTDCLDAQVLRVICYERKKIWIPFVMTLPTGITEEKESVLMERLEQSDFVLLTESGPEGGWPYDRQMRGLHPQFAAWCAANLQFIEHFDIFGSRMALYERREVASAP